MNDSCMWGCCVVASNRVFNMKTVYWDDTRVSIGFAGNCVRVCKGKKWRSSWALALLLPCFSVEIKHKNNKQTKSPHELSLISATTSSRPLESLNGHTFRFCWTVQDLEVFFVSSNYPFTTERVKCVTTAVIPAADSSRSCWFYFIISLYKPLSLIRRILVMSSDQMPNKRTLTV